MRKIRGKQSLVVLIVSLIVSFWAGIMGSAFIGNQTTSQWYQSIKPSITPPNWVFPIVWNILYILIALSLWLAFIKSDDKRKLKVVLVYGLNLAANALWSILYFGMRQPTWAFLDILVILSTIVYAIILTWKIDKRSSWLLVPYLLWVAFASVLNFLSI